MNCLNEDGILSQQSLSDLLSSHANGGDSRSATLLTSNRDFPFPPGPYTKYDVYPADQANLFRILWDISS
jgi:hypothetical protein